MKNLILLVFMLIMYNAIFVKEEVKRSPASINKVDCSYNKYVNKIRLCPNYKMNK